MSEPLADAAREKTPPAPLLLPLFAACALAGCAALIACAGVTVVSVLGRFLFSAPIPGDIEIVGLLMGAGVSLTLPYCQIRRGNVMVDIFTQSAPRRVRIAFDLLGCLAIAAIGAVFAWRMAIGGIELRSAGDQTMALRLPTWIAFTVIVPAMALLAVAGLITAASELAALRRDRR